MDVGREVFEVRFCEEEEEEDEKEEEEEEEERVEEEVFQGGGRGRKVAGEERKGRGFTKGEGEMG